MNERDDIDDDLDYDDIDSEELNVNPEQILNDIVDSAKVHAAATQAFVNDFAFYGKSLAQWSDELAIPVPSEVSPEILRKLHIKLANNMQIASHFYTVANTVNSGLVGGSGIKKADLVTFLVTEYEKGNKRRPAKETIERMADSYMKSTVSSRIAARIVKEFWRDRKEVLVEVRKNLEQISIGLHSEMKYLQHSVDG